MNLLREGEGKEKDRTKETVLPRERPRGTRTSEPSLNQHEAAAESLRHRFLEAATNFIFVVQVKRTKSRLPITGPA